MRPAPAIRRAAPGATRYGVPLLPGGFVRLARVLVGPGSRLRPCGQEGCPAWGSERRRAGRRTTYWCIAHDPGSGGR